MEGFSFMRQDAIGIDISVRTLWVAYAPGKPPAKISLKDADWQSQLVEIVPPGASVALEPTGWAYSAPIIRALEHIGATVHMVEHSTTGYVRKAQVASAKTDQTDAHALRKIALTPTEYRGISRTDERLTTRNVRLRLLVHAYMRADKERTRARNRMRQLAHSIHPRLGLSFDTYLRAAISGHITPDELHVLVGQIEAYKVASRRDRSGISVPEKYKDGRLSRRLVALVAVLPPWASAEGIRDLIAREVRNYRYFSKQRRDVRRDLYDLIKNDREWADLAGLWMTLPGANLGWIGAIISATHGQVRNLRPERFRAAVGVHPKISQSGEDTESIAGRPGFKRAKAALYLWTMILISQHENKTKPTLNPIGACFAAHKARGHKGAFFAARAKLANILHGIARTGQPYNPNYQKLGRQTTNQEA